MSTQSLRRVSLSSTRFQCQHQQQIRNASFLRRPHRPYTFTQLITLSDGSTYTARTTSPAPLYKSTKDTKNHALWQPSLSSLRNLEDDEAGRLRSFRQKFGRGWDIEGAEEAEEDILREKNRVAEEEDAEAAPRAPKDRAESLMDLISPGYNDGPVEASKELGNPKGKKTGKKGKN